MARILDLLAAAGLCAAPALTLAQPANDHCADAQLITDGAPCAGR